MFLACRHSSLCKFASKHLSREKCSSCGSMTFIHQIARKACKLMHAKNKSYSRMLHLSKNPLMKEKQFLFLTLINSLTKSYPRPKRVYCKLNEFIVCVNKCELLNLWPNTPCRKQSRRNIHILFSLASLLHFIKWLKCRKVKNSDWN